jgi:hypothetical protein
VKQKVVQKGNKKKLTTQKTRKFNNVSSRKKSKAIPVTGREGP